MTVTKPTNVADGDLILVYLTYDGTHSSDTASISGGFTTLDNNIPGNQGSTFHNYYTWYKIASGEPASWTITFVTTSSWGQAIAYALRGVNTAGGTSTIPNHSTKADASAYVTALPDSPSTI